MTDLQAKYLYKMWLRSHPDLSKSLEQFISDQNYTVAETTGSTSKA
jgi:hypothetical protein